MRERRKLLIQQSDSLKEALEKQFGAGIEITRSEAVGGGDINDAYGLWLSNGRRIFMKSNRPQNLSFFVTECEGLKAMEATGTVSVPEVLGLGCDSARGISFLLLSYEESRGRNRDYWSVLGCELAAMHNADASAFVKGGKYGFLHDNYIGAGFQENTPESDWITFFGKHRLRVQLDRAERYLSDEDKKNAAYLLEHLDRFLIEPEHPSLLHGDLWGGNVICGPDGKAWLIDPASYVGFYEADLAMTELFGGFGAEFYSAYESINPLKEGYENRREIYNLYHLLNHLNLFGGGYLYSVRNILGSIKGTVL